MLAKWESMSAIAYFNSIKVQLELIAPQKNVQRRLNFNSIKVQLELRYKGLSLTPDENFNSIKVQLELSGLSIVALMSFISIP